MTTGRLAQIGREDLNNWDGTTQTTFSRRSSIGGMDVLQKVGYEVDIYSVFGKEFTDATISKALTRIGSTNKRCLLLTPGTWTIASDVTISSNLTLKCPPGVTLSIASGKTLTIQGPIEAGPYQIFSGSGTVTISGVQIIHDQWSDGTGNAYYPSVDNSIDLGTSVLEFKNGYFDGTLYADTVEVHDAINLNGGVITSTTDTGSIQDCYITMRDANEEVIHRFPIENICGTETGFY